MPRNDCGGTPAKRFRIAFSFAGERREFVSVVASILAARFGKEAILYDKFHEAEFARHDLGVYLPLLYGEESELIVPVLCPNYDAKRWSGWEWLHIYGLLTRSDGYRVMPSRFEHAHADGLSPAAGFIELDDRTPMQFAELVLERLALNEGRPRAYYIQRTEPIGSTARIPSNLPRLQCFFGREAELQKIAAALSPDSRGWGALIDGPGGIGKTALAIRAAEQVPAGRFRRIIFLSSKERELSADGQRTLGQFVLPSYLEMLNAIARELELPELMKSPEGERSDSILRALRDGDVLLVLDNLETLQESDRDQLFAFLNRLPRGCSALVTSRRRADATAVTVRLDKLDWPAARSLLAEIAQNNELLRTSSESEWRALYEETGGNPLLIRWVTAQLGIGRCKTIAAAVERLRNPAARNNPLEFIFGDLLDTFTNPETQVLAALTHFSAPVSVKLVAELAGINEAAAQGALSDLSCRALVVPDLEECSFALVPMVADYLRRRRADVVEVTGNRLERHAYALIVENGYNNYRRFSVLDAQWSTLAAALPRFLAGENGRLQTVCQALSQAGRFFGRFDEMMALCRDAERTALAVGDFQSAGRRAQDAGWIHHLWAQSVEVLVCADRAEAHLREAEAGERELAGAIYLRGIGYRLANDHRSAISAFVESVKLWRRVNAPTDVANALNALGNAKLTLGEIESAELDYREALAIARGARYEECMAIVTGNLSALALQRRDWGSAEAHAREALSLSENVGRQDLIAQSARQLGESLVQQGIDEALSHARRAVEIYNKFGLPGLAAARETLVRCERASRDLPDERPGHPMDDQ
jgi:tetratricopeptide (TPR) repeat protein